MFGDHGLCGLLEEGAHGKSPKCLDGNLGDFGEFCKGLRSSETCTQAFRRPLLFQKTTRGQSPRYGWLNTSPIFKIPPLKIQKGLNVLLQNPQVFRRRLRSSESLKQWFETAKNACVRNAHTLHVGFKVCAARR